MNGYQKKIKETKAVSLDKFALGVNDDSMIEEKANALNRIVESVTGESMAVSEVDFTPVEIVTTIEDLKEKVLKVLKAGLDDPKRRYEVALGMSKYLFETKRQAGENNDKVIRVKFENLHSTVNNTINIPKEEVPLLKQLNNIEDGEFSQPEDS